MTITNKELVTLAVTAGIPTLAVFLAFLRNEFALGSLGKRIDNLEARITTLEARLDKCIETLDQDLREWARIVMTHNTDIARLKDKAGIQ